MGFSGISIPLRWDSATVSRDADGTVGAIAQRSVDANTDCSPTCLGGLRAEPGAHLIGNIGGSHRAQPFCDERGDVRAPCPASSSAPGERLGMRACHWLAKPPWIESRRRPFRGPRAKRCPCGYASTTARRIPPGLRRPHDPALELFDVSAKDGDGLLPVHLMEHPARRQSAMEQAMNIALHGRSTALPDRLWACSTGLPLRKMVRVY